MADKRKKIERLSEELVVGAKRKKEDPQTKLNLVFPKRTVPLFHQIAGHRHGRGKTKLGLLLHDDGSILKPLMKDDTRAKREHEFYKKIADHAKSCTVNIETCRGQCKDPVIHNLIFLTAKYLGTFKSTYIAPGTEDTCVPYLKIEDLVRFFTFPCIVDIKIGRITYGPDATPEKIIQQENKYPPRKTIGYQILSMRIYEDDKPKRYGPEYCDNLTETSIIEGLKKFVSSNPAIVPHIIECLEKIHSWFKRQKRYLFYGSSILIVYEAKMCRTIAKMIDFAHVHDTNDADENYIFGLEKLLKDFHKCISLRDSPA